MGDKRLKLKEIQFGNIAAEQERLIDGGDFLLNVFEDIFSIENFISEGKILILGRKGTGKTFLKEIIECNPASNIFTRSISFKLKDLEIAIQGVQNVNEHDLWKWIILCNISQSVLEDESITAIHSNAEHIKNLTKFLNRHRGYIEPTGMQLKEQIQKHNIGVQVNYFSRLFLAVFGKSTEIKQEDPPFFKVLPLLEELLVKVLSGSENRYFVFVDEIDEDYLGDEKQNQSIINLIRAAKDVHYNFNKKNIFVTPCVLLRSDIMTKISTMTDTRKLVEDLSIRLKWYDHQQFSREEEKQEVPLKKLISNRVKYSYEKACISKDESQSFWDVLFKDWGYSSKESFKFVADYTLYRPRDFVSLLNKIKKNNGNKDSITYQMLKDSIKEYAQDFIREWKFELRVFLDNAQLDTIFECIGNFSRSHSFCLSDFVDIYKGEDSDRVLNILYEYGVICMYDGTHSYWKHRESEMNPIEFDSNKYSFIVHPCIRYLDTKKRILF